RDDAIRFWPMAPFLRHLIGWGFAVFRSRQDLILGNMALRQQLLALHTKRPRRRMANDHQMFWIPLRGLWSGWKGSLVLVTPRTVMSQYAAECAKADGRSTSGSSEPSMK